MFDRRHITQQPVEVNSVPKIWDPSFGKATL
jgi:hypothetical protein